MLPNQPPGKLLGPDMSRPGWLGEIARTDPRLAVALLGGCAREGGDIVGVIDPSRLGWGDASCGWGWEILNLVGQFNAVAADQPVQAQLSGMVQSDLWVRKVTYTVEQPNAFPGNIFRAQAQYFNKLAPNITFTLQIKSHCQYMISPDPTPLELVENVFECVCPVGFVLGCATNMTAFLRNRRALIPAISDVLPAPPPSGGEIPTIVTITFHGVRLPTAWNSCSHTEAVAALQKYGVLNLPNGG